MHTYLSTLGTLFARLAFWRKPLAAEPAAADATEAKTVVIAAPGATEDTAAPAAAPPPSLLARFKLLFRRSPKTSDVAPPEAAPEAKNTAAAALDDAEAPEPKPTLMGRFKAFLRSRRRAKTGEEPAEGEAAATTDETADGTAEEAPPKSFLQKLQSKRVWIPALALLVLGVIGGVAALVLRASHETERLQKELQVAKHKLEQQHSAAPQQPAVAPASTTHQAAAALPKKDPAFEIIGAKAPEAEAGINAGDCVVSDREQVAANLKRCIESFNAALATSNKK